MRKSKNRMKLALLDRLNFDHPCYAQSSSKVLLQGRPGPAFRVLDADKQLLRLDAAAELFGL